MTNLEAYFRETKQLESEMIDRCQPIRTNRRSTPVTNRLPVRYRVHSREKVPSGCLLYTLNLLPEWKHDASSRKFEGGG